MILQYLIWDKMGQKELEVRCLNIAIYMSALKVQTEYCFLGWVFSFLKGGGNSCLFTMLAVA